MLPAVRFSSPLRVGVILLAGLAGRVGAADGEAAAVTDAASARRIVIEALDAGRPELLKPLLPARSKVQLALRTIAPARGLHDRSQFLVLLDRFFQRCPPGGFRPQGDGSPGGDDTGPLQLRGVLGALCPGGRTDLRLHILLERTGEGWRLSEVWEE